MPTRWWIPPPGPDESLRSTLNRAAALYRCDPEELWDSLNHDDPRPSPIDAPSCAALRRMAIALGTSAASLYAHRETDCPWRMPPELRLNYCPICWNHDIAVGGQVRMQRSWSHVLRTTCPAHKFPLMSAPHDWAKKNYRTYANTNLSPEDWRILDLIERFGSALEQSLFFRSPWPKGWSGTPYAARSFLILVNFSRHSFRDFPLTHYVWSSGALKTIVHGPRNKQDPCKRLSWDAFRWLADSAHRRAALWLAAWEFVPGLPMDLEPIWRAPPSGIGRYRHLLRIR